MIMSDERRMIGAIVTATFAATLGIGMLIPAVPLLTAGLPAVAHGALVSSFGLARLLLSFPSGLAIDRIGDRVAALAGLALLIAGGLIGIPDLGYAGLILSVVLQGAGISVFSTAAMTALLNKAGPERRGTAQSWFQGALLLSYSAGPVIGGYAVSAFGPRAPFAAEALLGLAALPIALMLPAHVPAQKKKAGFPLTRDFIGGAAMTFAGFLSRIAGVVDIRAGGRHRNPRAIAGSLWRHYRRWDGAESFASSGQCPADRRVERGPPGLGRDPRYTGWPRADVADSDSVGFVDRGPHW